MAKEVSRKKHRATKERRKQVAAMIAYGIKHEIICEFLDMSKPTFYKHYKKEIETGVAKATTAVASKLYQKALQGDNFCMALWLKSRAGWKDSEKTVVNNGVVNTVNLTAPKEFTCPMEAARHYKEIVKNL
jgi:hypothetical protein